MAVKHIKLHLEYLKTAISTALEYKTNFIIQVSAMILNDVMWISFWLIFFNKFNTIKGWEINDLLIMYSIICLSYGLGGLLFGNRMHIAKIISQGRLDFYLTLPKNRLYHTLISNSNFYDLGDVIFGAVLALIALKTTQIPLYIIFTISSTIILVSFALIIGSLAFFMGNSEGMTKHAFFGIMGLSMYPFSIYTGMTKMILLTLLPAGFITGVPVELLKQFNTTWFLATIGFSILLLIIAIIVFYQGLKKYESGNQLYVRT